MDHLQVHPGTAPAGNVEVEIGQGHHQAQAAVHPQLLTAHGRPAMNQQHLGAQGPTTWVGNDANTLLVVATLITTLTYQLGTNIPGGYWQDTKTQDGRELYLAGDPIMRDLHRPRYATPRELCSIDRSISADELPVAGTGCSWRRAGWGSRAPW
jgi:hypothetical protein